MRRTAVEFSHNAADFLLTMGLVLAALLVVAPVAGATDVNPQITIGVRAFHGVDKARARWQPTVDTLNQRISGADFVLQTYETPEQMLSAGEQGLFDFVITDPGSFVRLNVGSGVEELLSLVDVWQGKPLSRFGSVVFVRKSRSDILTLKDLRGLRLIAVSPQDFGGWQMVMEEFTEQAIDPGTYLHDLSFTGGDEQAVALSVRDGLADVGVLRTGTLERLDARGLIDINDYSVVERREVPGFPFGLSTDLHPEWVFAQHPDAPAGMAKTIVDVLRSIGPGDPAAAGNRYFGWQAPLDYWPVHLVLQQLRAAPYESFGSVSLQGFIRSQRYWLIFAIVSILSIIGILIFLIRRSTQLSRARGELVEQQSKELAFRQHAIDSHSIVSVSDAQGKIIYANEKFSETSGYSLKELLGQDHNILKSDAHCPEFFSDMWQKLNNGEIWTGEIKNRRKDGSFYWVHTTIIPQFGTDGEITKFVSVRTDVTDVKSAQRELNIREFFEFVPGEVFMLQPGSFEIYYANSKARKTLGAPMGDLKSRTLLDFLGAKDADWLKAKLESMMEDNGGSIEFDFERVLADGRRLATHFHIQFIHPEGSQGCFVATLQDVSGYNNALDQVAQLEATLDEVEDEIYMFWPDSRKFFYANSAAKKRIGLSEELIYEMTPSDLEWGPSPAECRSILAPMISGKTSRRKLLRKVKIDSGRERMIEFDLNYLKPNGRRPRFVATLSDVTDRVAAEEEVLQLKHSLDLIQNEVYMFWPETYEFTYLNGAALERIGWKEGTWKGKHTWDHISQEQQAMLDWKCRALIEGDSKSDVFETTDRNGTPLEIYLHLIEPKGEKPRFVSVYRDISDRRKGEEAKAQFISTVSHELRTPLTSIKGSLGLIKAGAGALNAEKLTKLIDIAYSNTERLTDLVNDILDWEKIEANQMTYRMEDIDLAAMVRSALEDNFGVAQANGVRFDFVSVHEPVMCRADNRRIGQVLTNLLSNAAKFSHDQGVVEVSLEVVENEAVISVRDYGIGIPEEKQATVFDRFTQVDSSDLRSKGGTGLGLSISRAIVRDHDGSIGFVSAEGEGSTFYFTLPLLSPNLNTTELKANTRPRILVCEDDPDNAVALWLALRKSGCRASIAPDTEKARAMASSGNFDGMTLGVGLWDHEGARLVQDLRNCPETAFLPMAIVASRTDQSCQVIEGEVLPVSDWLLGQLDEDHLRPRLYRAIHAIPGAQRRILHVGKPGSAVEKTLAEVADAGDCITRLVAEETGGLADSDFDLVVLDLASCDSLRQNLPDIVGNWKLVGTPVLIVSEPGMSEEISRRAIDVLGLTRGTRDELSQTVLEALNCDMRTAPSNKREVANA